MQVNIRYTRTQRAAHHRFSTNHGFHLCHAERLIGRDGREHKDIAGVQDSWQKLIAYLAPEIYPVLQTKLKSLPLKLFFKRAASHQPEDGFQFAQGFNEITLPFIFNQAPNIEQDGLATSSFDYFLDQSAPFRLSLQTGNIDSIGDY